LLSIRRWFPEVSIKNRCADPLRVDRSGVRGHYGSMDKVAPAMATGFRALVVDDEVALTDVVASYLKRESFEISVAHDGDSALTLAREVDPDVVILDIGLPGVDGIEVCRQLRVFSDAYVIMLTARDTEVDTIVGLAVGADDYITKPFSPRELVARVRAVLRRPRRTPTTDLDPDQQMSPPRLFGALRINVDGREVHLDGTPIMLTRTEFDVLAALSSRPGMVLSRRQLLELVWGDSWVGNDNIVDVHVGHLRRKLGDNPSLPRYVTTVRGVGYRMGTG
jgi:DNA-binding response OmpR family regulator